MELEAPRLRIEEAGTPGCRFCGAPLTRSFADLGMHPPCQSVVRPEEAEMAETCYPLHARVCDACSLVQIPDVVRPEDIFLEYAYFSSYSDSWVNHARRYVDDTVRRLGLGSDSMVVELASNDGYLLQHFVARGLPCLGVDPAANVAATAAERGVATRVAFFGEEEAQQMAAEGIRADLIIGNNVFAHTPQLNSFAAGLSILLAPGGTVTLEFPHLVQLVEGVQFDTIYHEHYSYFSFTTAARVLAAHGLTVHDVEELPTHGGSLRVHASHAGERRTPSAAVTDLLVRERAWGVDTPAPYEAFAARVRRTKLALLDFLVTAARQGKQVVGYGAAGKGNTLLNACGIRRDLLHYVVDRNPYKQHTLLPGSRIPVFPTATIYSTRPDYVLILPWNLRSEISAQMAGIREWGGRFVVPIPEVEIF